jgi:hypothetical protein
MGILMSLWTVSSLTSGAFSILLVALFLPPCLHPTTSHHTSATFLVAAYIDVGICCCELVPTRTMGLSLPISCAPSGILSKGDYFHVSRVDTCPIPAEMVNAHAFGDRANKVFVCPSMGKHLSFAPLRYSAVSVLADHPRPYQASVGGLDSGISAEEHIRRGYLSATHFNVFALFLRFSGRWSL